MKGKILFFITICLAYIFGVIITSIFSEKAVARDTVYEGEVVKEFIEEIKQEAYNRGYEEGWHNAKIIYSSYQDEIDELNESEE